MSTKANSSFSLFLCFALSQSRSLLPMHSVKITLPFARTHKHNHKWRIFIIFRCVCGFVCVMIEVEELSHKKILCQEEESDQHRNTQTFNSSREKPKAT